MAGILNFFANFRGGCPSISGKGITTDVFNPFTLRAAKTGLTILEIFFYQKKC